MAATTTKKVPSPSIHHHRSFVAPSPRSEKMSHSKRTAQAVAEETRTAPDTLEKNQTIVRVVKPAGNNLYSCELPNKKDFLFELAQRFRNTVWIKRGGYVLVETYAEPNGPVTGEIINVVGDEKAWRKRAYWPKEFAKKRYEEDDDESDTNAGKMPPSDSEDDY